MMKLTLTALALGALLCGCSALAQETPTADPAASPVSTGEGPTSYTNQVWGYTITLPEALASACAVSEVEDGTIATFSLKESGDMVFAVEAATTQEWKDQEGPWLGARYLGETGSHVFYLQLPTCGTLNQENVRETWEQLKRVAGELGPEDFLLLPVEDQ